MSKKDIAICFIIMPIISILLGIFICSGIKKDMDVKNAEYHAEKDRLVFRAYKAWEKETGNSKNLTRDEFVILYVRDEGYRGISVKIENKIIEVK